MPATAQKGARSAHECGCGSPTWEIPDKELLEALRDPKHERHAEFTEWIADDFDPAVADTDRVAVDLAGLATQWSRKPASKRPRPA